MQNAVNNGKVILLTNIFNTFAYCNTFNKIVKYDFVICIDIFQDKT